MGNNYLRNRKKNTPIGFLQLEKSGLLFTLTKNLKNTPLLLGDDATIIDVMEWMINTQLGRRNLPPAQRLAVMDKFKKKIQEQARENMSIGGSSNKKGSPIGEPLIENKIRTDKELAKMAGVGTGTVARFNKVMKVAVEYVRLCGYKNGEIGNGRKKEAQNGLPKMSLDEIASQLGTSKTNLKRALSIERNLTESMKELLDTGVITKTLAADTIAFAFPRKMRMKLLTMYIICNNI